MTAFLYWLTGSLLLFMLRQMFEVDARGHVHPGLFTVLFGLYGAGGLFVLFVRRAIYVYRVKRDRYLAPSRIAEELRLMRLDQERRR